MNRMIINLNALLHNIKLVDKWIHKHNASWTLVTKVLCGHADTLKALQHLGVRSMADSRITNLRAIEREFPDFEAWYLRLPHFSVIQDVVLHADVSLNSEIGTIKLLNKEAAKQGKVHRIIIMIEIGDLREGILPGNLVQFYEEVFEMPNIEVAGIGANFGCLSGVGPNIDQIMQLILYKELLELKFKRKLQFISGGNSAVLPLLLEGKLPPGINHFRVGEAVFLGTDLINGGTIRDLRNDVFTLEAEIVEIREKNLVPMASTTSSTPFENISIDDAEPGERGYRVIVTLGQLDTEVSGLIPLNPDYKIAGASSDLTVVNIGKDRTGVKLGDTLKFRPNYAALLRAMSGKYIGIQVTPSIESFASKINDNSEFAIPLDHLDEADN